MATITVGEPGAHGADAAGIQGIGVNTPSAAAVPLKLFPPDKLLYLHFEKINRHVDILSAVRTNPVVNRRFHGIDSLV